ncbi:MAG: PAS domain S-box protein [Planctomycetota bacterium]
MTDEPHANAMQEQEAGLARYRAILAAALDPIITIDARGTIESASDSVWRVFGWTPNELIGQNVNVLMPEPHRSGHDGYLRNYGETGRTNILGEVREFEACRKDGSLVPIDLCVSRVDIPGQTEPLFTAVIHDLTARKRTEGVLRESAKQLQAILEHIDLLGVSLDRDGRITFINETLLRLTGWTRDEALGRNWFESFLANVDVETVFAVFSNALNSGDITAQFENEILTRDGAKRLVLWHNAVIRDVNGTVIGVTALGQDITEQRRSEEERARAHDQLEELVAERTAELESTHEQLRLADRLASIGTLAAGLGHDMNNVLLPIRCRLDALDEKTLTTDTREHFGAVRDSLDYLQQLTDGLHLLALDPDDPAATQGTTDIAAWWKRLHPLLTKALPKSATLLVDFPEELPVAAVPSHRLSQAILNLVVNASEAIGPHGSVRVSAQVVEDRRFVRLIVTDDGQGMSDDVRHRALDPFFTTKTRGLGTGLGLSLVHGVIRSAGGTMRIDSEPGQGTAVTLTLPTVQQMMWEQHADGTPCRTRIDVVDRRVGSLMESMASAVGMQVANDVEVEQVDVWITSDSRSLDAMLERPVAERPPAIIVVGELPADTPTDAIMHLPRSDDFQAIRACLQGAVERRHESRS